MVWLTNRIRFRISFVLHRIVELELSLLPFRVGAVSILYASKSLSQLRHLNGMRFMAPS